MRVLVGVIAVSPFVLLLFAMITRRARVQACCGVPPVAPGEPSALSSAANIEQSGPPDVTRP